MATALSELSRELAALAGPATITLALTGAPVPAVHIEAEWTGRLPGATGRDELAAVEGIAAAARLTDICTVSWREDGGMVALTKKLPTGAEPPTEARVAEIVAAVRRSPPAGTLDALRSQNQDLLHALESLQARQQDLLRANAELEETNRGVLAMHAELFDELEQTNRGVVALYAELDEASTRLQEASRSKTRFWANVSHELRTPLNSVLGLSRLLLDPASEGLTAEQRYQVELIRDSGAMLLSLVNELLDVAKAESGRMEARCEATDLHLLFDDLRASLRPIATDPEVELVVEDPGPVGLLWTDPVLLARIVRNLVSNGLKFTERGEVRCRARVDGPAGVLDVIVTDTGIGMTAEHRRRIFEEFYQIPGTLQARAGGTGLGLPYSRRLAEILGGSLVVTSEPGRGTTVTLRLPLAAPADARPVGFGSVLVVDDDPAFRAVLLRVLGAGADRFTEAADGEEALRALRSQRPDLVLLDLNIPPPDGVQVLTEMRGDPRLCDVPVVVVTSAVLDTAQRHALGATAVLLDKAHLSGEQLAAAADAAARLLRGPR